MWCCLATVWRWQARTSSPSVPRAELIDRFPRAEELTLNNHLLMPGLVNAHGHLAMTLLRGLGEGEPLKAWLENTIWPLEGRWMGPGFVRDGTLLAVAEMIASGTTTAADMYYFPEVAADVCRAAGFRLQIAFPIIEAPNPYASGAHECLDKGLALHDRVRDDDLVDTCFGPHSAYAVAHKNLERVAMLADELDIGVQIHLHETARGGGGRQAAQWHNVDSSARQHRPVQRETASRPHDRGDRGGHRPRR